ncbi:MAG: GtrA family protein [Mucilaginibacter sp.]|nr:GtrA family protein [Mucilaginibacter sp.]
MDILNVSKYPDSKGETLKQIIKYAFVGGICTILDFGLLFILTNYFHVFYLISSTISFSAGTILNYYLCTLWIFKVRVLENKKVEFFYYLIITAVGLGITTLIIWLFTEYFKLNFMLSKLIATFITVWWNFSARKYFLHTIK